MRSSDIRDRLIEAAVRVRNSGEWGELADALMEAATEISRLRLTDAERQAIAVASADSQPVAYAVIDDEGVAFASESEAESYRVFERKAAGKFVSRNPRVVPLYRQPQPTLTDAERNLVMAALQEAERQHSDALAGLAGDAEAIAPYWRRVLVWRGLLERLT